MLLTRHRRTILSVLPLLVGLTVGLAFAAPAARPVGPSATRPAATQPSAEAKAERKKVIALTRRSIQLLQKNKLDEAEPVLKEALALDPTDTTNLYNYACLLSLKGRPDAALDYLQKAAEAGWADFVHLARDPDLNSLRELPRYKDFVGRKAVYQKRAAEKTVADLKTQFGDGYLYELDEERKLIFATNTDRQTLTELKAWLQAQANSQWAELFEHRPDQYIAVVLPSPSDYREIVKVPGVGGFYNDNAKLLICQRLGQTMTHEFTHALHAADKAPLGQDHAIWVHEGLASLYEAARFEGDRLVPQDNFRLNMLQNAARGRNVLIPLEKLLKMEQPEFVKKANLAYGQAGSVMLYLHGQNLLRPFYDTFKKTFDKDPTGRLALEQVTGRTLAEFEKEWSAWMTKRERVPFDTGDEGPVIGAAIGDATDGVKIESVMPNGPAAKAGLAGGDVLVGLAGGADANVYAQVRDYQSFVPMLIQFKPGDQVKVRVRRAGNYLELPLTLGRRSEVVQNATNRPGRK